MSTLSPYKEISHDIVIRGSTHQQLQVGGVRRTKLPTYAKVLQLETLSFLTLSCGPGQAAMSGRFSTVWILYNMEARRKHAHNTLLLLLTSRLDKIGPRRRHSSTQWTFQQVISWYFLRYSCFRPVRSNISSPLLRLHIEKCWSVYPSFSSHVLLLTILNTAATQVLGNHQHKRRRDLFYTTNLFLW